MSNYNPAIEHNIIKLDQALVKIVAAMSELNLSGEELQQVFEYIKIYYDIKMPATHHRGLEPLKRIMSFLEKNTIIIDG